MRSFNPSRPIATLLLAVAMTVPIVACSDDDTGQAEQELVAECKAISDACHHGDQTNMAIAMCHGTAHENDAAQCTAISSSCLETCHAGHEADGGHDDDGGGATFSDSGAAGDSGP